MIVENLKINCFRNIKKLEVLFCENKNLIYGINGSGKTSILEAIYMLGFGKSFLNVRKSDLINYNSKEFFIYSILNSNYGKNDLSAKYNNRLFLFLNGKKTNIVEINKYLFPVFFSSSNYNLYVESKPYIRKMINMFIFGVNSLYIHYILCYNRALKQKNYLLKTSKNRPELSSWNKIMSEMSEKVIDIRKEFIDTLNTEIQKRYKSDLKIEYKPSPNIGDKPSSRDFYVEFEKMKELEIKYKKSLIGPHLDHFMLNLDNKNLKFNSSGEKKINLLMIYISFIELFREIKNEYPVFLVDDYDAAIDGNNINFLTKIYPEMQIIATSVNQNSRFDRIIELKKEN